MDDEYYYYDDDDYSHEYYQDYPLYRWINVHKLVRRKLRLCTPTLLKLFFPDYFVSVYPSPQLSWTSSNFCSLPFNCHLFSSTSARNRMHA